MKQLSDKVMEITKPRMPEKQARGHHVLAELRANILETNAKSFFHGSEGLQRQCGVNRNVKCIVIGRVQEGKMIVWLLRCLSRFYD